MLQAQRVSSSLGGSRGAAAAPRPSSRPSSRRQGPHVQGFAARGAEGAAAGSCPFAAASSALQGAVRQLGGEQQGAQQQRQGSVQTPGPDPFSLQSLRDVR